MLPDRTIEQWLERVIVDVFNITRNRNTHLASSNLCTLGLQVDTIYPTFGSPFSAASHCIFPSFAGPHIRDWATLEHLLFSLTNHRFCGYFFSTSIFVVCLRCFCPPPFQIFFWAGTKSSPLLVLRAQNEAGYLADTSIRFATRPCFIMDKRRYVV